MGDVIRLGQDARRDPVAGEVMIPGPHGLSVDRTHTCLVTGSSLVEWPDGTSEVFTPASDVAEINEAQRDQAHREIAVTDLETCCWKIPRTAVGPIDYGSARGRPAGHPTCRARAGAGVRRRREGGLLIRGAHRSLLLWVPEGGLVDDLVATLRWPIAAADSGGDEAELAEIPEHFKDDGCSVVS